ncbi:MAG: ATP-binding protein [Eggerthellaceae bacterium]|nr:ATP-binding protein [Eggerthellaceae bacterium]
MYYPRIIEPSIAEAAKSFPCVALYGPRQVGKSTVLRHLFPDVPYVTLDDAADRALAQENPRLFLETYGWPLAIDEVHKAPELFEQMKIAIDQQRLDWLESGNPRSLMYLVSGSNQFELREHVSETLAGRIAELDLSSFSQREAEHRSGSLFDPSIEKLLAKARSAGFTPKTRREIFESIFRGGMPDVVTGVSERDVYFKSYVSTYIEKDVLRLIAADRESTFVSFMEYAALRTAQQVNYDDIARNIGIDNATCKRWFSILESSGVIVRLQPYLTSASTRIVKTPKMYFMDTGLCAYLCKWPDAGMLERCAMAGAFYETYVVSEMIKSFQNANVDPKRHLYYYRDKDSKEVDILYVKDGAIFPIEVKKGISPVKPTKNFSVLAKYKMPVMPGLVIDSADKIRPINENAYTCPVGLVGA